MENNQIEELLKQIEIEESKINEIKTQQEESGMLTESMEAYLNSHLEQFRKRKQDLIQEFKPKTKIKIELDTGDESPKAKDKPNTPKSFNKAEKRPFYSVHEIKEQKKSFSKIPATTKCTSTKFEFSKDLAIRNSACCSDKKDLLYSIEIQLYQDEQKKMLKEYEECRGIMNSAHEVMLNIKEMMLELKEIEIENKVRQYEQNINSKRGGFEFEAEKKKISMNELEVCEGMRKIV